MSAVIPTSQQRVAALREELASPRGGRPRKIDLMACLAEIDRLKNVLDALRSTPDSSEVLIGCRRAFAAGYRKAASDAREQVAVNNAYADDIVSFLERGAELRESTADNPAFTWYMGEGGKET